MSDTSEDKKLFGTATIGAKGQIVIPSNAREELNLKPGDKLYIAGSISKQVVFCLKEEQLQALISKLTNDAESSDSARSVQSKFEELKGE